MINVGIYEEIINGHLIHTLKLERHANYAPEGQDIVCSAVSIIACTLANRLDELNADELKIRLEPGDTEISCAVNSDYPVRACFEFAEEALEILAIEYPENIS